MLATRSDATLGDEDPVVVLAADDNFAIPLAATVRSALDTLRPERKLRLYLLDGGMSAANKDRLAQSWPLERCQVEWIHVDGSALDGLPVSGHISVVSYYRILIPRLLPKAVQRVIYLDSDLIVRADLARLWDLDLQGRLCLAAQDCSAPFMDSSQALANFARCEPYLGTARPVPNFQDLELPATALYFNAGILLVDLAGWRQADVSRQALECLEQNREHVQFWDQYALNVVLAGRWGQLDARWNQGSHVFQYPNWEHSPFDRQAFDELRDDPYIIHFTTKYKPWGPACPHPLRGEFFASLDRTAWAGWRPARLKVIFELVKSQERRLRRGRKWLGRQASQWFRQAG